MINEQKEKVSRLTVLRWLLRVVQGALIGGSAILPGISGGVLCVIFGIYQPMMELIAHPFRAFKKHVWLLLPVLIGFVFGFLGLARLVEWLFSVSSSMTIWLFFGLIAGMGPSLYKEAGKQGRPKSAVISFVVSFAVVLGLLIFLGNSAALNIQPNMWWFFVCGLMWGVSLIAPGLSSSSLLIFFGLYEPMAAGIGNLDMSVIIPLGIGVVLLVLASARGINHLFNKHYPVMFHVVMGFVVASTIMTVVPTNQAETIQYTGSFVEIASCAGAAVGGFLIAWLMDKAGQRLKVDTETELLTETK